MPFGNAHSALVEEAFFRKYGCTQNKALGRVAFAYGKSFDASMMGNKLSIEDAYRFAKGDPLVGAGGETMQLSRPWILSRLPTMQKVLVLRHIAPTRTCRFATTRLVG